jgi:serine/threonine protein kinase
VSNQSQSDHPLTKLFLDCLNDSEVIDRAHPETIASIQRLKDSMTPHTNGLGQKAVFVTETSLTKVVKLVENSDGNWEIRKSPVGAHEMDVLKCLNHPLIIKSHKNSAGAIVTEFAPNGSLADHLPSSKGADLCQLRGPTRIATIIAGIAVAMNFVHTRGIVHGALNPDHIFIDWDWTVRIGGFGQSTFITDRSSTIHQNQIWPNEDSWQNTVINNPSPELQQNQTWPEGDSHFFAPECYSDGGSTESDVFSFALILYELIVGQSALPPRLDKPGLARLIAVYDFRPPIPDFVPTNVKELIEDCWATNPADHPTFDVIVFRLEQMQFKLTAGVNSTKVAAFVKKIEEWESTSN